MITTNNNDKMLHFGLTALGALIVYLAAIVAGEPELRKAIAMFASFAVALGKELWDARHLNHTSDGLDFVAGMAGAGCMMEALP